MESTLMGHSVVNLKLGTVAKLTVCWLALAVATLLILSLVEGCLCLRMRLHLHLQLGLRPHHRPKRNDM